MSRTARRPASGSASTAATWCSPWHDDGPGMDADTAARAFERFYRGDPARSRATGGAGLGLSIVAAIVEAHGGTVALLPTDTGATFEVRIPTEG